MGLQLHGQVEDPRPPSSYSEGLSLCSRHTFFPHVPKSCPVVCGWFCSLCLHARTMPKSLGGCGACVYDPVVVGQRGRGRVREELFLPIAVVCLRLQPVPNLQLLCEFGRPKHRLQTSKSDHYSPRLCHDPAPTFVCRGLNLWIGGFFFIKTKVQHLKLKLSLSPATLRPASASPPPLGSPEGC